MLRFLFRLTISMSGAAALLLLIITLLGYFFPDPTRAKWQSGQPAELAQVLMRTTPQEEQPAPPPPTAAGPSAPAPPAPTTVAPSRPRQRQPQLHQPPDPHRSCALRAARAATTDRPPPAQSLPLRPRQPHRLPRQP